MKVISTDKAPAAIGPYSQGFIHNGIAYFSGAIPVNPATGEVPEGIDAQTRQACENCGALLEAAGLNFSNVIKTTCFLADIADFTVFNDIYAEYFVSKPARSCVAVKDIPKGVLCEIEIMAVTGTGTEEVGDKVKEVAGDVADSVKDFAHDIKEKFTK